MALTYVPRSEREDFEEMLRDAGRAEDFEATDGPTDILAPPGTVGPRVSRIVVRCRRTSVERGYSSGGLSITTNGMPGWVNDVAADILGGAFD